jgi:hypothetical protein
MIRTPVEFWGLNNSRIGSVRGLELLPENGNEYFVDPGKVGQGWQQANATGRTLRCQDAAFTAGDEITLSFWYRRPDTVNEGSRYVAALGSLSGTEWVYLYTMKDFLNRNSYSVSGAGMSGAFGVNKSPADTLWHHWCCTFKYSTGQVALWIDGVKTSWTTTPNAAPAGQNILFFGGMRYPAIQSPRGDLDCYGIWNEILSDSEIAELYNAGAGWEYVAADNTPDAFTFAHIADADPSTVYASDSQIITGMDSGTAILVTGGEYRVNGGSWTSSSGTINPGDPLELRATSSSESEGVVTVTVTVGTISVDWTITTGVLSSVISNIVGAAILNSRILRSRIVAGHL